jgi:hypothetical protein
MNLPGDIEAIKRLSSAQRGCFSKADIQTALAEPHASALVRRISALQTHNVLRRFSRGWYVTADFDAAVLSQRLAPTSYISLESVLGDRGIVGVRSERRVVAVKSGKARAYGDDIIIEHLGVDPSLAFGWDLDGVVRRATPEKALLDALYFYQHGRRLPFDPYSDVIIERLDRARIDGYLKRYKNPKFVVFVERVLSP